MPRLHFLLVGFLAGRCETMALVRPRLTDFHGIHASQAELDFAIPIFNEDLPLYVDPFLLWRSPSQQDQTLHTGAAYWTRKFVQQTELATS
jgi:hypothetical protein